MSASSRVMVVLTGAYGNLGDAVIRRRALEWARPFGEVHAYVGNAPKGWIEQLELRDSDVIYRVDERAAWIRRSILDTSVSALVLDPGEVPLRRKDLLPETVLAISTFFLRLRGKRVIRPPRGLGARQQMTLAIHRVACRLSTSVLWRDESSKDIVKVGQLVPDTAFAEPHIAGHPWAERTLMLVSMRGKRSFPSDKWCDSVRAVADHHGLTIRLVTQVRDDESRSEELASTLGAELDVWADVGDLQHEQHLRELYKSAAFVVSDRLHVLILSSMAGAIPLEVVDSPVAKISTTFGQIGVSGVTVDLSVDDVRAAVAASDLALINRDRLIERVGQAKRELEAAVSGFYA